MKLLYLFIKNHPVFDNQEFNFDSNERFHFDHWEKRLKGVASCATKREGSIEKALIEIYTA